MSVLELLLHGIQTFLAFITLCCVASLARFQQKWHIGISGLTTFLIITTLLLFLLPLAILLPPLITRYRRRGTLERITTCLREDARVRGVLAGCGMGMAVVSAISVSASVFSQQGCKDPTADPHAPLGTEYRTALPGWCRTKRASAVFLWLLFGAWCVSLGKVGWETYTRRTSYRSNRTKERALPTTTSSSSSATEDDRERSSAPGSRFAYLEGDDTPLLGRMDDAPRSRTFREAVARPGWEEERDVADVRGSLSPMPRMSPMPLAPPLPHGPAIPHGPTITAPAPGPPTRPRLPSHSFSRTPVTSPPVPMVGISRTMILAASDMDDPYARSRTALTYGKPM